MDRNEFFQALPVTRVSLRLIGATLELCTDDIDDIHVMVSGDANAVNALRVNVNADQLTVEQPAASLAKSAAATSTWLQVTLRLPRSWKGSIDARTVSGWINARSLAGADLGLDTVSGILSAADLTFMTVTARTITGDMKLTGVASEKCTFGSTSGSITVQGASMRTGSASTVTGAVTLSLTAPFEDLSLTSVSGDLRISAPVENCDAVLRSVSGRIRTSGVSITECSARVRASTVSSDLDITRSE